MPPTEGKLELHSWWREAPSWAVDGVDVQVARPVVGSTDLRGLDVGDSLETGS
jgi:hypothetical protein